MLSLYRVREIYWEYQWDIYFNLSLQCLSTFMLSSEFIHKINLTEVGQLHCWGKGRQEVYGHTCAAGHKQFYNLGLQGWELELDLARTEPSVPIPACIQSCWESPSHHFIVFVPFPPPLAEMFWLAVLQSLWVFPPAVSPVCCLIPGGACWFLGLVCSRGIALPAPGQDGLAVCSAPAWCVQFRVTELWILAVFMYSHNGESLG